MSCALLQQDCVFNGNRVWQNTKVAITVTVQRTTVCLIIWNFSFRPCPRYMCLTSEWSYKLWLSSVTFVVAQELSRILSEEMPELRCCVPSRSSWVWTCSVSLCCATELKGRTTSAVTWRSFGLPVNLKRIPILVLWAADSFELLDTGITGINQTTAGRMCSFSSSGFGTRKGLLEPIFLLAAGISSVKKKNK